MEPASEYIITGSMVINNETNHIIETNNIHSIYGKQNLGNAELFTTVAQYKYFQTVMSEMIKY